MNIIQKILYHVLPLPYIERDGIKFWTKRAYDDYLVEQELNKACANTNQQIKYYVCPGTYAHEAKAAYYKFLEFANTNNCRFKIILKRFEPCNGAFEVKYVCDKTFTVKNYYI